MKVGDKVYCKKSVIVADYHSSGPKELYSVGRYYYIVDFHKIEELDDFQVIDYLEYFTISNDCGVDSYLDFLISETDSKCFYTFEEYFYNKKEFRKFKLDKIKKI